MLHNSMNSASARVPLFQRMFPDSSIASRLQLQRTKMEHLKKCLECNHIVAGFDESLNTIAQKGQMDISVLFWSAETNQLSLLVALDFISVHCAFKAAVNVTQWNVVEFLSSLLYYLFKNVPAGMAVYCRNSSSSQFPLKFCVVRLPKNARVVERVVA
ncbi:hypothetical protein PR048_004104 [Dryococelus australis]|uniref:Uncharacterized protein n=1 Tax=Dryococelus australis TaxID=614101 RepID=A0ABQ9I5D8_9NEOP|nr:hypothetical protein PR048_004104 [Dryococelus australis]